MRRRMPALFGLAALLALIPLAGSRAAGPQPDPRNPHGTYNEDCSLCHSADAWVPAHVSPKFDHARSGFPLEGAHAQASCASCHTSLEFNRLKPKSNCVDCHEDIHQGEFGQDCTRCHTPRSFIDHARMARAHTMTRFPLVGAHLVADCEDCHRPASPGHLVYVNLSTDCVSCHRDDYDATTNPSHTAGNFPLDCAPCHSPIAWRPARFPDHDGLYFPIYSGKHRGKWSDCSDCHINPGNFNQFECILCHEHDDPVEMADKHSSVSVGYSYVSSACYGCHPDGRK